MQTLQQSGRLGTLSCCVTSRAQLSSHRAISRSPGTAGQRSPFPSQQRGLPIRSRRRTSGVSQAVPVDAAATAVASYTELFALADVDAATAGLLALVLRPVLSISILLMIVRIVLTWFPEQDSKKFPWVLAYTPTEPVLGPTRKFIQPVGGVDISPIVWVALLSFFNEILLGPQGILNLLQRQAAL